MKFTAAAVQMTSGDDKKQNLKKAWTLLKEGVDKGASLLGLPENFSFMGVEGDKIGAAEEIEGGETVDFLKRFAVTHRVWLLGGSLPIMAGGGKVFNTSLLINDEGKVAARYDKIHLFDVDIVDIKGGENHRESKFVARGETPVCAGTPFGRVGMSICYDLRFPELYRRLVFDGARIVFIPAAFTAKTGEAHWEMLIRARAVENQLYVIAPAQCGRHPGGRQTFGHSMIVGPWGDVMAGAGERETVVTAEIDLSFQDEVRRAIPCLEHAVLK